MINRTLISKSIELREGESLCDFQCSLSAALGRHLGLGEYDYCCLEWVNDKICVAWRWIDITGRSAYLQFAYTRDAAGVFTFGDPVVVEPRTTFVPKP